MTPDEDRRLLADGDPARNLPTADPELVAALLEDTMTEHPETTPASTVGPTPARSRWLLIGGGAAAAALLAAVAIGVGGSDEAPGSNPESPLALPTLETTELVTGPAIAAKCAAPAVEDAARQSVAFEGLVTQVAGGTVTLAPTRFFTGAETPLVSIAAPDQGMSEAPAEFVVGQSYIVGAVDGQVSICGLTGPAEPDLRALYESAFGR